MESADRLLRAPPERLIALLTPPFDPQPPPVTLPGRPASLPASAPFQDILVLEASHAWSVSTHIFPAAWPRTRLRSVQGRTERFEPLHYARPSPKGKEAISEAQWLVNHQNESGFIDLRKPETYEDQDQLWIAVNRYARQQTRERSKPGFTIVFSHATGLHKESCEAVIAHLVSSRIGDDIDEIWALDCANQGDSAILNAGRLGDTFFWPDSGRDIAKFLLQYLPALGVDVPAQAPHLVLPQQPLADLSLLDLDAHPSSPLTQASTQRIPLAAETWRGRIIVGSGHSLGGGCSNFAASSLPSLFSGLVYVDPILPPASQAFRDRRPITAGALARRDSWTTREEAARSFAAKAAFFGVWDPPVLRRYVEFALHPSPTSGTISLKALKRDEALVFADTPTHSGEQGAGGRVAFLPSWLASRTHFILPDIDRSVFPESALAEMLANGKGCSSTRVKGAGHLLMQEAPKQVAKEFEVFLGKLKREGAAKL